MSAFICNKFHIDVLITYYLKWGSKPLSFYHKTDRVVMDDPSKMGQILTDENYKSFNYLYPTYYEPTPIYTHYHRCPPDVTAVQIIKACDCLIYQSCETPDYYDSLAYALVQAIRETAIDHLPGMEEAEWLLEPEKVH